MTRLDRLNSFLSERLSAAVNEILVTVRATIQEYEEETAQIRKENHYLKQLLKSAGRSGTEADSGAIQTTSPEKQNGTSNLEPETEPQQCQNQQRDVKDENTIIKTEQISYSTNRESEPETRLAFSSQTNYTVEPNQSVSHLNPHNYDQNVLEEYFPLKIKLESLNTDTHAVNVTENMDSGDQSWSPQAWERPVSERGDECCVRHGLGQPPYGGEGAHSSDSAFPPRPAEFPGMFGFPNRFICTNRLHHTSRLCEMMKRNIAKSSPVWKYFSLKEGDCSKAVCLICKAVISRGVKEYTTSALLKHLRLKHGKC